MFMNNYLVIMLVNDIIVGMEIWLFDVRWKYVYLWFIKLELILVILNDYKKVL